MLSHWGTQVKSLFGHTSSILIFQLFFLDSWWRRKKYKKTNGRAKKAYPCLNVTIGSDAVNGSIEQSPCVAAWKVRSTQMEKNRERPERNLFVYGPSKNAFKSLE